MKKSGFRLLERLGERRPELQSVDAVRRTAQVLGRALGMDDAASGRHPVDRTGLDPLHRAKAVPVQHRAVEQVGDRREPDMRMGSHVVVVARVRVVIGPKWSKKTKGPTLCVGSVGNNRRTMNPPPMSLMRGRMMLAAA